MDTTLRLRHLLPFILTLRSLLSCDGEQGISAPPSAADVERVMALSRRGEEARNSGDFRLAIETHDSCIKLTEAMHDTLLMAMAYNNQGTNMRRIGDLTTAASLHYASLALSETYADRDKPENIRNMSYALNGIGNVYLSTHNFKAAERTLRYALGIEQKRRNLLGEAINYANIGSVKEMTGDADSARILYRLSMQKNREAHNDLGISLCYSYLANLDKSDGNITAALAEYHKAYTIGRRTSDAWHWIDACAALAGLHLQQNRPDSAAMYIGIGMEAARAINSKEHIMRLSSLMSSLMEARGDIAAALEWTRASGRYRDTLQQMQTLSDIHDIRIDYISQRTQAEIATAKKSVERERRISHITVASATLIVILAIIAAITIYRLNALRRRAAAEREIFYRNMTHRLRTPMTVVLGMVEQLGSHIPGTDTIGHQSLDAARRQSYNLLELIKTLIAASREGRLDDINLSETAADAVHAIAAPPSSAGGGPRPRYKVLLAEDNDDVAMMICSVLSQNGYDVERAADGVEALARIRETMPDILVTDIAMPRMDGIELIRTIRADDTFDLMPVIVVSARVGDSDRLEGIEAGAEVYLAKPFISRELLLRVEKLIDQRERMRRNLTAQASGGGNPGDMASLPAADREYLERIIHLIDTNINCATISSQQLADMVPTSRSQLNRRIRNITGMSTTLFIRQRRMIVAKRLLRDTSRSIGEIETICGFDSPGYFSRMFKTMTGMTPSEYRKLAAEGGQHTEGEEA